MIFNYLIGNADAHGKNSSVLYRGSDGKRLAPIYDVMSTEIYSNLSKVNAMSIGRAKTLQDVNRGSFSALAQEAGMRPLLALNRLDSQIARIVPAAVDLASEMSESWPSPVYGRVVFERSK